MNDEYYMRLALAEAKKAAAKDEIPIGACVVMYDEVLASNHNRTRELNDPLAHAELLVLQELMRKGCKYLYECTLYVTLEPCMMCAGAIILAKVGKVVYGAKDPKSGVAGSVLNVFLDKNYNHHPELKSGVLAEECALLLTDFFKKKR